MDILIKTLIEDFIYRGIRKIGYVYYVNSREMPSEKRKEGISAILSLEIKVTFFVVERVHYFSQNSLQN